MGADRTKAQFNNLAGRIEKSWNEIVSYDNNLRVETVENKEKKLCIVSFVAIITGRENGVYLPNIPSSVVIALNSLFYSEAAREPEPETEAESEAEEVIEVIRTTQPSADEPNKLPSP
ncbi:hypothetical protein Trihar35433_4281 [Trichoderma harzianum]|nr:hypothetical protein Trihar35433_4281 [Trichoderma harzianum]